MENIQLELDVTTYSIPCRVFRQKDEISVIGEQKDIDEATLKALEIFASWFNQGE